MATKNDGPRDPKLVVRQADLLLSSPERVKAYLEARAAATDKSALWADMETELKLLGRNDPLLDLTLARFGANDDVLRQLMARPGAENKTIRLAVLLNEVVGRTRFNRLPGLLASRKDGLGALVAGLDSEEIAALFSNPSIADDFLVEFFEQKAPWLVLDEDRRLEAVQALQKNPRMHRGYEGPMDGYAEYRHELVFTSAWQLAAKVPVSTTWASYLAWLYYNTTCKTSAIDKPMALVQRWVPDPSDTERVAHELKELERGELGVFGLMRKQLARLVLDAAHSGEARQLLATHEDPAVRAAVYAYGHLSASDMKVANERDFRLAFDQMMWNDSAWLTKEQRSLLHDMAWDGKRDPNNRLDPQNMFDARAVFYAKEHPEWFKDEEPEEEIDPELVPTTVGSLNAAVTELKSDLYTNAELARSIYQVAAKVLTRTAWLAWGLVALLVILLIKGR
jgi:hypothetical protein